MCSSHDNSDRLIRCLVDAGIHPTMIRTFIFQSINRPPIKHKNLREAIRYRLMIVQAERLLLLLPAS